MEVAEVVSCDLKRKDYNVSLLLSLNVVRGRNVERVEYVRRV